MIHYILISKTELIAAIECADNTTKARLINQIKICIKEHFNADKVRIQKLLSKEWERKYSAKIELDGEDEFIETFELLPIGLYKIN